jgi:TetR/AcrR family transcriptional regulator, transcriptional repressor for nem operon
MPRVSKAETKKNRGKIDQASARLFREQGFKASVDDVMSAAGLTHGGFYGHFRSKDALMANACATAFDESVERWRKRIGGAQDRRSAHAALIDGYLTSYHRESLGTSCPIAALATDVAREAEDKPVRKTFREGLEQLLDMLTEVQPSAGVDARDTALAELATLVGAMVLARATKGDGVSDEFMNSAKRSLLEARERPRATSRRHRGS